MDKTVKDKARRLIHDTRVMTLAVCEKDIPWSSPVYFLFHEARFYFFSNETSRHIREARDQKIVSASIFQDADKIDEIFGLQMSGVLEKVSKADLYVKVVKKYVSKFSFLREAFGPAVIENKDFFLEKFKSRLFYFQPTMIFLSDNSKTQAKTKAKIQDERIKIDLSMIS